MKHLFTSSDLWPSPPREASVFPPVWNALQKEGCSEAGAATFMAANLTLLMVRLTASPLRRYPGCSPWSRAFRRMRGHVCAARITQKQKQTGRNGCPAAPSPLELLRHLRSTQRPRRRARCARARRGRRIWWDLSSTLYYFPVPGLSSNQNQLLIIHRQSSARGAHTQTHTAPPLRTQRDDSSSPTGGFTDSRDTLT